jgi:hypothetical protein
MKLLLISSVVLVLIGCTKQEEKSTSHPVSADIKIQKEAPYRIDVSDIDRTCTKDSDCETIGVQCSCNCGESVNKTHTQKYVQLIKAFCEKNPPDKVCKMVCNGSPKCQNKLCTYRP